MKKVFVKQLEEALACGDFARVKEIMGVLDRETKDLPQYLMDLGLSPIIAPMAFNIYWGEAKFKKWITSRESATKAVLIELGLKESKDFSIKQGKITAKSKKGDIAPKAMPHLGENKHDFIKLAYDLEVSFYPALRYSIYDKLETIDANTFVFYFCSLAQGLSQKTNLAFFPLMIEWLSDVSSETAEYIIYALAQFKLDEISEQVSMGKMTQNIVESLLIALEGKQEKHYYNNAEHGLLVNAEGLRLIGKVFVGPNGLSLGDIADNMPTNR